MIVERGSRALKEEKQIFGELKNVRLTLEEYNDLLQRFGKEFLEKEIFSLSTYMVAKKKTYPNHYATLLKWCTQDNEKSEGEKFEEKYKIFLNNYDTKPSFENIDYVDEYKQFVNNFDTEPIEKTEKTEKALKPKKLKFDEDEERLYKRLSDFYAMGLTNEEEEYEVIDFIKDMSDKRFVGYFMQTYQVKFENNSRYMESG